MRPIDADALKDELRHLPPGGYAQSFAGKACLMAIDDTPTLDYAPVRHGEWEWDTLDVYMCSACGEKSHVKEVIGRPDWGYCPNCGAKMDGGEEQ